MDGFLILDLILVFQLDAQRNEGIRLKRNFHILLLISKNREFVDSTARKPWRIMQIDP